MSSPNNRPHVLHYATLSSPLGELIAYFTQREILLLQFAHTPHIAQRIAELERHYREVATPGQNPLFHQLAHQLAAYFAHERTHFDLPLAQRGTPFQQAVWQSLQQIPYGATCSYAQQAQQVGRPKAVRAVANANRLNPFVILIPCHRVIGSKGDLVGYAGALWRKDFLLRHEEVGRLNSPLNSQ